MGYIERINGPLEGLMITRKLVFTLAIGLLAGLIFSILTTSNRFKDCITRKRTELFVEQNLSSMDVMLVRNVRDVPNIKEEPLASSNETQNNLSKELLEKLHELYKISTTRVAGNTNWNSIKPEPPKIKDKSVVEVFSQVVRELHDSDGEVDLSGPVDKSVADQLNAEIRVLCWVMTHPKNHRTKAANIKSTWGKRCNILLFMSTELDHSLPTIKLPIKENRELLWGKTKEAFKYIYKHHRNDADWFMKVHDDTYVVVENLRYMLLTYSTKDRVYFSCQFKPFISQGYMSGGAGYVLSRAALESFIQEGLPFPDLCKPDNTGDQDNELVKCLKNIGIKSVDTRDALGRDRLFPFSPRKHLYPHKDFNFWYRPSFKSPTDGGLDCCSEYTVTFHDVSPREMHEIDFFIYHMRPYGITPKKQRLTNEVRSNLAKKFLPVISQVLPWRRLWYDKTMIPAEEEPIIGYSAPHRDEDRSVADAMAHKIRVLCWIMTTAQSHKDKAVNIKATWGQRCNMLLFVSTEDDQSLPAVKLKMNKNQNHPWARTKEAYRYIYENHRDDADWFYAADENTYVVVENIRYMVAKHISTEPIYSGYRLRPKNSKVSYMSGAAGYVISRGALDKFVKEALTSPKQCKSESSGLPDVELGRCLTSVGVKMLDSRDSLGHGRFFPYSLLEHMNPNKETNVWFWESSFYPAETGTDCCSDFSISFHYDEARHMYELDYFIYHLRLYGVTYRYPYISAVEEQTTPMTTTVATTTAALQTKKKKKKNKSGGSNKKQRKLFGG